MLRTTVFSPVKQGAFYQAIMASAGRRLGSPRRSEIPLNSYYAARNERGDNPRHLFSHLSTHIHITKRACVRGVFICIVWASLYATGGEIFDKRNKISAVLPAYLCFSLRNQRDKAHIIKACWLFCLDITSVTANDSDAACTTVGTIKMSPAQKKDI